MEPAGTIKDISTTVPHGYVEVIAVDDCSDPGQSEDLSGYPGVSSVVLKRRKGLFEAKRRAIEMAKSDRVVVIDAHMRFDSSGWAQRLADHIDADPTSITCTACFGFGGHRSRDERGGEHPGLNGPRSSRNLYYGGNMVLRRLRQKKAELPRLEIMEPKWQKLQGKGTYDVPCVLGACYGLNRSWFYKIGGFGRMRTWGGQEMCLSLKSWLAGGRCQIDTSIEVGHFFRTEAPNPHPSRDLWMNRMRIAEVCLPREAADFVVDEIGEHHPDARGLFKRDLPRIKAERRRFQAYVGPNALDELLLKFPQIGWDVEKEGRRCGTALARG